MSAETLRRAAALMRERAAAARAGRWFAEGDEVLANWQREPRAVAVCEGSIDVGNVANAEHIASWHPAVALAVADWLVLVADGEHVSGGLNWRPGGEAWCALAVARAYLGES